MTEQYLAMQFSALWRRESDCHTSAFHCVDIFRFLIYLMPQGRPSDESFMIFNPFLIIISFLFAIQLHFIEVLF